MNKTLIAVNKRKIKEYPSKEFLFRPNRAFPEYPFVDELSFNKFKNPVYEMIRESFHMLGYDNANYGTNKWNPLGKIVKPGNKVLLKPNMVLHHNNSNCGNDCLYTHPSLVAAIIDYVYIALKGKGEIIVGDAPLQECDFDQLTEESGYDELIRFYQTKGVNISLCDFRNIKTFESDGLHYLQNEQSFGGIKVRVDESSAFQGLTQDRIARFRITNYDPRALLNHHSLNHHEYNVSNHVLEADVIINMPKPKTHRKAGVTISLKNLVGINANKEYLPHHTLGSIEEGGDAYKIKSETLSRANKVLDLKNELINEKDMENAALAEKLYVGLLKKGKNEQKNEYWEGSWYGNDTIWRTIVDLNRILLYADKHGILQKTKQRKLFVVGDMIISGQKEGPLEPVPIHSGVIVMGEDSVWFDRVVCSIMGFDYKKIPSIANEELVKNEYCITDADEYEIISNYKNWDRKSCEYIYDNYSLEFEPSMGWIDLLGNKYRDRIIKSLKQSNDQIYVFGAGDNGKYAAKILINSGINICGFIDNNEELWGKNITNNLKCMAPNQIHIGTKIVVGLRDEHLASVKAQIEAKGGVYLGLINRGI